MTVIIKTCKFIVFSSGSFCQIYRVTDEGLIAETMVWPNFFLMNVFCALKGSKLFIIIASLTFGTRSICLTQLTFCTIRIPERDVFLSTLRFLFSTRFEVGKDKLGNKFLFRWYGSQVTQMILHDVFIARRTMVFSATMVFFPCLGRVDHFVTCQAFPPFFTFRSFIYFWHYVSGNTFWIDTSCDISDTSVVHPFLGQFDVLHTMQVTSHSCLCLWL